MLNNTLPISLILSFITTLIVYFINKNNDKNENNLGKSISYFIFIYIIFIVVFYLIIHIYNINSLNTKNIIKIGGDLVENTLKKVESSNDILTGLPDF